MRKLTIGIWMVFAIAVALWMFPQNAVSAERRFVKAPAHVAGIVIGKPVRTERNVVLGTVENVVFNDSGCARYLILSGRFSGARSRLYPIPWDVIARSGPDAIFVKVDERVLAEAPSFEVNRWPDFSRAEWETEVHNFYRAGGHAAVTEKEKSAAAVSPQEKTKVQKGATERMRDWRERASKGLGTAEEKLKSTMEKQRTRTPAEVAPGKSSEQKQIQEHKTRPERQQMMMRDMPKTMQGQQPKNMMEKGPAQQNIQHTPAQMGTGTPQTMSKEKPEKTERGLQ